MYLWLKLLHVASVVIDWNRYDALTRRWELWGAVALLTPLGALALMILKPVF